MTSGAAEANFLKELMLCDVMVLTDRWQTDHVENVVALGVADTIAGVGRQEHSAFQDGLGLEEVLPVVPMMRCKLNGLMGVVLSN